MGKQALPQTDTRDSGTTIQKTVPSDSGTAVYNVKVYNVTVKGRGNIAVFGDDSTINRESDKCNKYKRTSSRKTQSNPDGEKFEYHIVKYTVKDKNNTDQTHRFLFFLEKTYVDGTSYIQLCMIPKDWNDALCSDEQPSNTNCRLSLPDGSKALLSWDYTAYKTNDNVIGFIDFEGKDFTLQLTVTFSKPDEKAETIYSVDINFVKKEVIGYKTRRTQNKLIIDFDKPLPEGCKGEIEVVNKSDYIPCLTKARYGKVGKKSIISPHMDKCVTTLLEGQKGYFRIRIPDTDKDLQKYYVFHYTGKDPQKKNLTKRVHARDRERTCLYCAQPIDIPRRAMKSPTKARVAILERSGRTYIRLMNEDGTIAHKDILIPPGATKQVTEGKTVKKGTVLFMAAEEKAKLTCLGKGCTLQKDYNPKKCVTVALLGAPGSGKSTFLSRLFNIKPRTEDGKLYSAIEFGPVAGVVKKLAAPIPEGTDKNAPAPFEKYVLSPGKTTLEPGAQKLPFVAEVTAEEESESPAYISFFDVAGADLISLYANAQREGYFAHHHANGIMLFIDVNHIIGANETIRKYIEQYEIIKGIKVSEKDSSGLSIRKDSIKDVALAVVLCRFDEIDTKFDENSAIRQTGPAFGRSYKKSAVSQYINSCSGEIEAYLTSPSVKGSAGDDCDELLKAVKAFRYRAFFAVSSIGQAEAVTKAAAAEAAETTEATEAVTKAATETVTKAAAEAAETTEPAKATDVEKTYFLSEPRNMEYVFAWLLYQTGIID